MNINSNKSLYIKSCFNTEETVFEGIVLSTATGFLLKEDDKIFLITNRHVVTGKNIFTGKNLDEKYAAIPNTLIVEFSYEVERKNGNDKFLGNPFKINLYKDNNIINENKVWLEHPVYKDKVDIVAIDVTDICQKSIDILCSVGNCKVAKIPVYENINDINFIPEVTNQVFVVGYPYGYTTTSKRYLPIWSRGTIASEYEENLTIPLEYIDELNKLFNALELENDDEKKREIKEKIEKVYYYEMPMFLVDAKTRNGQSGSPVIMYKKVNDEEKTFLLGIYSGRINEKSDLGYVWKTELIKEIVESGK